MRKVFILYYNFYTPDGKEMSIGGIQTYIKMLIDVILKIKMTPLIYQYADVNFENIYNGVHVYGVEMNKKWSGKKKTEVLLRKCMQQYNSDNDIIIFASDTMGVKNKLERIIGIQHGVSWDIKNHEKYSHPKNLLYIFWRAYHSLKTVIRVNRFQVLVAVDYNFLNWYRTQVSHIETDVKIIPNCTKVNEFDKMQSDNINIIFARRFTGYRGTRLLSSVFNRIIDIYNNVHITFAGSGPDESYLKNIFAENPKVQFIKYDSDDSFNIHQKFQIAVIPSIGSEGTSLSLLEAMAAKCAVVATNVGGMTNIILDNYNGLLVSPDEQELYDALEKLITNKKLRERLADNAFQTVTQAFNKELWVERWIKVIMDITKEKQEQ